MKRDDILLVILAIALFAAAVFTIIFGGEKSRHGGYGSLEVLQVFCLRGNTANSETG